MNRRWLWLLAVAPALILAGKALADYAIRDGNGVAQTVFAYVCQGTKICPSATLSDFNGNPIGTAANPVVVYDNVYRWTNMGYCQLTSLSAATSLSTCIGNYGTGIPAGATAIAIDVEGSNVRETGDGVTTPTATLGMRHPIGSPTWRYSGSLSAVLLIQETPGAIVNITFLK